MAFAGKMGIKKKTGNRSVWLLWMWSPKMRQPLKDRIRAQAQSPCFSTGYSCVGEKKRVLVHHSRAKLQRLSPVPTVEVSTAIRHSWRPVSSVWIDIKQYLTKAQHKCDLSYNTLILWKKHCIPGPWSCPKRQLKPSLPAHLNQIWAPCAWLHSASNITI